MFKSRIPLRIRLSLGSALRLSLAIAAFGIIAYETSKRAALAAAEGRVRAAAFNFSERASVTLREILRPMVEAARDPAVIASLRSGVLSDAAREALARLPADTAQTVSLGLRTGTGQALSPTNDLPSATFDESLSPDSAGFGRVVVRGDTILYEASAPVFDGPNLVGSLVRVRRVTATPTAVRLLSDLMGAGGTLLFGNRDGSFWTDLTKPVTGPPSPDVTRYHKNEAAFIVASQPIPGTPYAFAAEFPEALVLAPVRNLVRDFVAIGLAVVVLGLIASWWSNGRITKPLTDLTQAAEAITAGNQPGPVPGLAGGDELGRLQRAFQTMSESVWQARAELEDQVRDRTQALEDSRAAEAERERLLVELSAERSRLEDTLGDLRTSEEALRLADRRKDDFLAMLAHELRNPLAPIRNAVHILKVKSPEDPNLQWSRDVIDRQVAQMSRLLDDLLDMSRISHNRLELRPERVDLGGVILSAVETSRPLIDGAGHALTIGLPPEPIHLEADPVRLAQVFSNLLNNSAKYSSRGARISIVAERQGSDVVVSVSDDGIGITADALPHIFDMFTQVRPGRSHPHGGLGIGLSLVQGLVALHGGTVTAESGGSNQGSTFTVRLPMMAPQAVSDNGRASHTAAAGLVGRRILVADDLDDNTDSLAALLQMLGHEVVTARDGEEAVRVAERSLPEIVLLDLGMPKLDGYEACRQMRQQTWGQDMVLIALTGWGQDEDRRRTAEAGFDFHLVKPVDPPTLITLLDSAIEPRA